MHESALGTRVRLEQESALGSLSHAPNALMIEYTFVCIPVQSHNPCKCTPDILSTVMHPCALRIQACDSQDQSDTE